MSEMAWMLLKWGMVGGVWGAVLVQACLLGEALWAEYKLERTNKKPRSPKR